LTRILALDYGSARCGCAVSDPTGILATPLAAIPEPASKRGIAEIARLVEEHQADEVVVGLPISLSGEEGPQAAEVRKFVAQLDARLAEVPKGPSGRLRVSTYDERFTTRIAQRMPGRSAEDSRAAAHLLESYLLARRPGG
jgi:putative holliday junction resolvase